MTVSIRTDLEDDLRRLRSELATLRYELAQARRGCDAAGRLKAENERLRAACMVLRRACDGAAQCERIALGPTRHPAMTELLRELEGAIEAADAACRAGDEAAKGGGAGV